MTADQLRQALDIVHWWIQDAGERGELDMTELLTALDAARFWLNLLQADEKTMEKVAAVIYDGQWGLDSWALDQPAGSIKLQHMDTARAVLSAIVGEET